MSTQVARPSGQLNDFFGVVTHPQSYRSILYLLLGLPLGTAYFVFIVTGVSVGASLIVLALIGIPILIGTVIVCRALMQFERYLANGLTEQQIENIPPLPPAQGGWLPRIKSMFKDSVTWTGMLYMLLRFPLGIATFTIAVTLIALAFGLLFAPAWSWTSNDLEIGSWTLDPFPWSWLATLLGIPLVFVSFHLMNGLAHVSGLFARSMLERPR